MTKLGADHIIDRSLADIALGDSATFDRVIHATDIDAFARLSGDQSPLHIEVPHALSLGFSGRVAHGHLVAAPLSTMAGHLLPGKRALLTSVHFELVAPVYAEDHITYAGTVVQISAAAGGIRVDVVARRGTDVVLRGSYQCLVLAGPAAA